MNDSRPKIADIEESLFSQESKTDLGHVFDSYWTIELPEAYKSFKNSDTNSSIYLELPGMIDHSSQFTYQAT